VRYLGFSAHSVAAALSMMDRFDFDSILFPVNFVLFARGNFGPQVMQKARQKGLARLALKALAHRPWRRGEARTYPNCWYRPIDDPTLALKALRFTLSEEVVSAIPPGDERLYRMTLDLARRVTPMTDEERRDLLSSASGLKPLMRA